MHSRICTLTNTRDIMSVIETVPSLVSRVNSQTNAPPIITMPFICASNTVMESGSPVS